MQEFGTLATKFIYLLTLPCHPTMLYPNYPT